MSPGDRVIHEAHPEYGYGILLQVDIDKELMRSPWAVPWKYVVLWGDCLKRRHETGIIRRVRIA